MTERKKKKRRRNKRRKKQNNTGTMLKMIPPYILSDLFPSTIPFDMFYYPQFPGEETNLKRLICLKPNRKEKKRQKPIRKK